MQKTISSAHKRLPCYFLLSYEIESITIVCVNIIILFNGNIFPRKCPWAIKMKQTTTTKLVAGSASAPEITAGNLVYKYPSPVAVRHIIIVPLTTTVRHENDTRAISFLSSFCFHRLKRQKPWKHTFPAKSSSSPAPPEVSNYYYFSNYDTIYINYRFQPVSLLFD